MTIPQLLNEHIEELRARGYKITAPEIGNEVFIVFSDYSIPSEIWNRDTTELLVKANQAYPQSKMDMFWVTPGLRLQNGNMPQNGDCHEDYLGRQWQRFSWHPEKWIPGRDTLITFLEFIDHRFYQNR